MFKLIEKWKINKTLLADKMGIPRGTFGNKISQNQSVYSFSSIEIEKLKSILLELRDELNLLD
jgi:hypothetical protein